MVPVTGSPPESPPNFIIIMADDLGYGDVGCYGSERFKTPHIDKLADQGLRFTDFHSNGALCSPTRAALLTGRYQQRAGIDGVIYAPFDRNRHHGLQIKELTFAEVLKDSGYRTAIVGKWHLGYEEQYNPIHQGFDRFSGYVSGNVDYFSHIDGAGVFDWWKQNSHNREPGYTTRLITRHAVEFIKENHNRPFCLYIAHESPHDPYQGPGDDPVRKEGSNRLLWNHREPRHAERAYAEMLQELDRGIGQVVEQVQVLGIANKTLLFFFSDNGATGPGSNGRLYGKKGTLWEGGHRVPAIAWWSGKIEPGRITDELATTLDLMPTIVQLSGATLPADHQLDGISLTGLLLEEQKLEERQVFWKYREAFAMREGPWKLVLEGGTPQKQWSEYHNWSPHNDGRAELALFNFIDDVREAHNLADEYPDKVDAMRSAIMSWVKDVEVGATAQPAKSADN
jgi:arylsulfatase A-like enzyme